MKCVCLFGKDLFREGCLTMADVIFGIDNLSLPGGKILREMGVHLCFRDCDLGVESFNLETMA